MTTHARSLLAIVALAGCNSEHTASRAAAVSEPDVTAVAIASLAVSELDDGTEYLVGVTAYGQPMELVLHRGVEGGGLDATASSPLAPHQLYTLDLSDRGVTVRFRDQDVLRTIGTEQRPADEPVPGEDPPQPPSDFFYTPIPALPFPLSDAGPHREVLEVVRQLVAEWGRVELAEPLYAIYRDGAELAIAVASSDGEDVPTVAAYLTLPTGESPPVIPTIDACASGSWDCKTDAVTTGVPGIFSVTITGPSTKGHSTCKPGGSIGIDCNSKLEVTHSDLAACEAIDSDWEESVTVEGEATAAAENKNCGTDGSLDNANTGSIDIKVGADSVFKWDGESASADMCTTAKARVHVKVNCCGDDDYVWQDAPKCYKSTLEKSAKINGGADCKVCEDK